ncbi:MAG: S1 RNA-binding domain-containing protein [Acutalibacteraceae bacterium]
MTIEVGNIYDGKVSGITKFGAFVVLEDGTKGLVHISEISSDYIEDISSYLSLGDSVKVKVLSTEEKKINFSIKKASPDYKEGEVKKKPRKPREPYKPAPPVKSPGDFQWQNPQKENLSFEDMMSSFKRTSEDKMCDLKKGKESRGYSRRGNGRK